MAEEQALVQLMDTLDGLELTKSEYEWLEQRFAAMTEKQKATLMLFYTRHILGKVVRAALGTEVDKIEIQTPNDDYQ